MAGEIPRSSGGQHKVNSSSSSNDQRIIQEELLNNICVQTGEEFSPQFFRGRGGSKELNEKDSDPRKIVDKNQVMVYDDLTSILGLRIDSERCSDSFAAGRHSAEAGIAAHNDSARTDYSFSKQGSQNLMDIRCFDQSTLPSDQYCSGSPGASSAKIKLLCSFGGKIVPRQSDGKLRYFRGETRIISIREDIIFEELMRKTYAVSKYSHTIKYQLPGEDLDALVSVMSDEDLHHMIDEYHGVEVGSHRLRIFLVPSNEHLVPSNEHETNIKKQDDGNSNYVVPTNGISHTSLKNCFSGKNLANQVSDLGDISKNGPTFSTDSHMMPQYCEINSNFDASFSSPVIPLLDVFQPSAWSFLQTSLSSVAKELYQRPLCDDHLYRNSGGNVYHHENSCCERSSSANCNDNNHHCVPAAFATYNQNCNMLNGGSQNGQKGRAFENQTAQPSTCYPQKCLNDPKCIRGFGSGDTHKRLSHAFSDSQLQQNQNRKYLFEGVLGGSAATYVPSPDLSGGPELSMQHEYVDKQLESVCQIQPPIDLGEVPDGMDRDSSKITLSMKFGGTIDHSTLVNTLNHKNAPSCEPDSNFSFKDIVTIESQDISWQDPQGNTPDRHSPTENLNSLYELQHTGCDANIVGLQSNSSQESPMIQSRCFLSHASNPVLDLPKNESAMLESSAEKCDNYYMNQVKKIDARLLKSQSFGINHSSNNILEPTIVEDVTAGLPFGMVSSSQLDENNPGVTLHEIHSPIYTKFPSSSLDSSCQGKYTVLRVLQNVEDNEVDDSITDASMAEIEAGVYGLQIIRNADLEELEELGSGTYGTVYHAKWRGTDVAIKRIKKSCFTSKPSDTNRLTKDFWREAQILSTLHHPNVVAFYGVVPDGPGGTLATVTEFMVNGSLKHALRKKDYTLNRSKRLMIAMDAAFGMEYLHLKNIVHFDLKCDNLLVNLRDHHRPICKVGDFGLSRIKQNTLVSGGVRGTLPWMAPELLNNHGNRVSEKVDVFSFGIAMWELLTRQDPYADMHCGAIIGGIVNNTLRPPVPQSCDNDWRRLMEECWMTNPVARPSFTDITKRLRAMSTASYTKNHDGHM